MEDQVRVCNASGSAAALPCRGSSTALPAKSSLNSCRRGDQGCLTELHMLGYAHNIQCCSGTRLQAAGCARIGRPCCCANCQQLCMRAEGNRASPVDFLHAQALPARHMCRVTMTEHFYQFDSRYSLNSHSAGHSGDPNLSCLDGQSPLLCDPACEAAMRMLPMSLEAATDGGALISYPKFNATL